MSLLPEHNRIVDQNQPEEVIWNWKGNSIHIDHYKNSQAKARVLMIHGVGGNGRLLSFLAAPLYRQGFDVVAPDLPGYGLTHVPEQTISWDMWYNMTKDLLKEELFCDDKPLVIFGLSAGGMLAYRVACAVPEISGIVVTNILDQRNPKVREASAIHPLVGRYGAPMIQILAKIAPKLPIPMKMVANTRRLVNDKKLQKLLITDKHSAGATVPLMLVASMVESSPAVEPENFIRCPLLMVHPGDDRWTPVELSRLFFDRLNCPKELVMLENAGHFPVEQPGLSQMEEAVVAFLNKIAEEKAVAVQ